jgi:hypothetical protein
MVATVGLPGSSEFKWRHGKDRKALSAWQDSEAQRIFDGTGRMTDCLWISDKEARKAKWRDGRHIFLVDGLPYGFGSRRLVFSPECELETTNG